MRLNQRETLLAMGDFIAKHGFSPTYQISGTRCGCFMHALHQVCGNYIVPRKLLNIIGGTCDQYYLRDHGWDESAASTRDAVAMCRFAADLATK